MIYQIKILDSKGRVKEVISANKVTDQYWDDFYKEENQIGLMTGPAKSSVPNRIKKKIDEKHMGLFDFSFSFIN